MLLPQIVAISLNYLIFAFMFRKTLPETYESDLLQPSSAIKNDRFFKLSLFVLVLVLVGYFVGSLCHIQPYAVALAGCSILLIGGFGLKQIAWSELRREVSWELFPFVIGLFVVVKAVENIGIASFAVSLLKQLADHDFLQTLAIAFISGIGSNIVNNIPMALVAISIVKELHQTASQQCMFASLLGCNLGPNLTIFGSLATMLVITAARKRGENIGAWDFFKAGAVVTPLLLVACSVALWVSKKLFG
jgi:arsenical pump membrane protein